MQRKSCRSCRWRLTSYKLDSFKTPPALMAPMLRSDSPPLFSMFLLTHYVYGPDVPAGTSAAIDPEPAITSTVAPSSTVGKDAGVVPGEVLHSISPSIIGEHAEERYDDLGPPYEGIRRRIVSVERDVNDQFLEIEEANGLLSRRYLEILSSHEFLNIHCQDLQKELEDQELMIDVLRETVWLEKRFERVRDADARPLRVIDV